MLGETTGCLGEHHRGRRVVLISLARRRWKRIGAWRTGFCELSRSSERAEELKGLGEGPAASSNRINFTRVLIQDFGAMEKRNSFTCEFSVF